MARRTKSPSEQGQQKTVVQWNDVQEEFLAAEMVNAITSFLNDPKNREEYSNTQVLDIIFRNVEYFKKYKTLPPKV